MWSLSRSMFVMATFLEPPPMASVAAVIGFAALSFAIGLSGGSRETEIDQGGSADIASGENSSPISSLEDDALPIENDAPPTESAATGGSPPRRSGDHE